MQGDVYCVFWLPGAAGTTAEKTARNLAKPPPLLSLDATVCHAVSEQPGFAVLLWDQVHLLRRVLALYPSDRYAAFNAQMEMYEQLANDRGSASLLGSDSEVGGYRCCVD
ncbi:hypothetical protein ABL78_4054 [Leptomonas seymouri]|uniref:TbRIF5 SNase domain-containing protein n=1 Tax=Leptomonas seymouri TaxID=5684 RepID=A0A0N1PBS1_LEPSE|nr:hypothetical protein ABL78_4054 [Leptomonas seymouri]|eukprot:KPI86864.1 hypothetical protein ABL78_4054 [Leptomonas seymouri]